MRMLLVVVPSLLLLACGGSARGPDAPGGATATCPEVARRLVVLAIIDNGLTTDPAEADRMADSPPASLHGAEAEFREQCARDEWTAERRNCLHAARTQDGTPGCPEH